jgi:magnesium chelatase family protein
MTGDTAPIPIAWDLPQATGAAAHPIRPAMSLVEALETTRLHCVAGLTGARAALITTRPFRAPHHTISDVGWIGGGHIPMPGEVSRAPQGVVFLDELPECRRQILEVLRQSLEDGVRKNISSRTPLIAWR